MTYRFIDLFAGIGGFHLGLSASGGKCVYSSEWDKYAADTYEAWTKHTVDRRDIREVDYSIEVPDHEVLAAGFPCQPFSLAGVPKRNSLGKMHGFQDLDQGNLFFSICDIAKEKNTPVLILENVKNLASHDGGNTWKIILESLEKLDYEVRWQIVDAKKWVPQHRERIFIIAVKRRFWSSDFLENFAFPELQSPARAPKLKEVLDKKPDPATMLTEGVWEALKKHRERHQNLGNGFGFSIADPSGVTRTLSARYAKDGGEVLIQEEGWPRPRKISVAEARKLMGFTDEIKKSAGLPGGYPQVSSKTQSYKQFGNSLSPLVAREVGKYVSEVLRSRLDL